MASDFSTFSDFKSKDKDKKLRLQNILAKPIELSGSYLPPSHSKSQSEKKFIDGILKDNFVFAGIGDDEKESLIDAFEKHSVNKGTTIITQGEVADFFYIIEKGSVVYNVNNKVVGKAKSGDHFGELALLYNSPRSATCIAEKDCQLWRLEQETFRRTVAGHSMQHDEMGKNILKKIPFLQDVDDDYLTKIFAATTTKVFPKGEVLVSKGEPGKMFYILKKGKVKVTDISAGGKDYGDIILESGDYFGERAIVTDEPRAANVTAIEDVVVFCLTREVFLEVLGPLSALILQSKDRQRLRGIPAFAKSDLQPYEFTSLAEVIVEVFIPKGTYFCKQNRLTKGKICLIRSGKVSIEGKEPLQFIGKGGYFGEETLITTEGDQKVIAQNTIQFVEDSALGYLPISSIEAIVQDLSRLHIPSPVTEPLPDSPSIEPDDLMKHSLLGVGTFGRVWLVSNTKDCTDIAYALKVQNKADLIEKKQAAGVVREKKLMESINHPFIVRLVASYQDKDSVYMLLHLVQGGELYNLMNSTDTKSLPEDQVKFYSAGILEGLVYMHRRFILYRDLKPENVMIDKDGYTVIVDLGFAKIVPDKTYTLCGTPLYLAPEVILSRGHDKACDHWSWAVLIYEMVYGKTPFYKPGVDQIGLFRNIVQVKVTFPDRDHSKCSKSCKQMLSKLFKFPQSNRLGSLAGHEMDIKNHEWFSDINFADLVGKKIRAPWTPEIKNALDTSSFDQWDDEDASEGNFSPLSEEDQAMFENFGPCIDNLDIPIA